MLKLGGFVLCPSFFNTDYCLNQRHWPLSRFYSNANNTTWLRTFSASITRKWLIKLLLFNTRYRPMWDVTIAGRPARCPVWLCSPFLSVKLCIWRCTKCTRRNSWVSTLVTVPTDPFTRPTDPFLSEWAKCQPGNTQNGGTVLPIANLITDSEPGSLDSYSSFLVTTRLSRLVSEIFACDRQTDRRMDKREPLLHLAPTLWRTS